MRAKLAISLSIILLIGTFFMTSFHRLPVVNATSSQPALLSLAYFYIGEGLLEWAAHTLVKQGVEADSDFESVEEHAEILLVLALLSEAVEDWPSAKTYYEQLVASDKISPKHKDLALALLGELTLRSGDIDQAKELLEKANENMPNHARVVYALGQIAEQSGDLEDALAKYLEASEISRDWLLPVIDSASVYNRQGAHDEAAKLLFGAELLGVRDVHFHLELARSLQGLFNALSSDPDLPLDDVLKKRLGLEETDRANAALRMTHHTIDRALQLSPDHPEALTLLQGIPPIS